jgi:peptide/nickel transport system permease protein
VPRIKELRHALYLIGKSPLVVAGIVILASFVIIALLAPYITTYGPEQRIWADTNLPPGAPSSVEGMPDHILGTDDSGGDIYSRLIWAAQVDLRISLSVVLVAVAIGTFIGAVAGYYGGKVDELVMRVTDVFFAFPGLVLAMAIVMALGQRSLDNISIALMVTWWPTYARLARGQVLAEREKLYVEAARSIGASDGRILLFHIIPNTIQPLIVQSTMDVGSVLLTAAGLAFIGFGPPAGAAEWGLMIAIGQLYFSMNQWAVFFPGMAILLTALASNLVGDGLRDILDPKLRRR